jgi:PAS domain S-box-containing protein
MAVADDVARFADLFAEPLLLVSANGDIALANRSAREKLHLDSSSATPNITEFTNAGRSEVQDYLKLCARSAETTPGALSLKTRGKDTVFTKFHCNGRSYASADGRRLVLLHLIPREVSVSRFVSLNQRIEQLTREITLRLQTEKTLDEQREVLRVTLSSIGDAVIATDMEGRISFMNGMAETNTGWKQTECLGVPLDEVFQISSEETGTPVESPVAKVLAGGVIVGLANHTVLIRKDGSRLPIDDTAAPIRSREGTMIGVVLVFHDVGDRRRLERELMQQAYALKEADRRKDEFLAMLGHELRNPLATLRNCVHILEARNAGDGDLSGLSLMMSRQADQLTRLVDDLLDISRITRGLIRLDKKVVSVATMMEHALETVRPFIDEKGHQLNVTLPESDVRIEADLTRIAQALCNLLTNAAKYTEPRGRISLEGTAAKGRAEIRVRDTGIGIRPDLLPHVFDLFRQADRALDRSQGGLGIGLTVARNLAQMHGGEVTASSAGPGQGSEFVLSLPLTSAALTSAEPHAAPRVSVRRKVLIVDDNRDAADSLAMVVSEWGCDAKTAADGPAALEQTEHDAPDVVLLDIGLPGMDGYEVAQRLRARAQTAACKIIAVSGYGADQDRRRAHEAGVDHHLTKPVDLDRLRELVRHA